MTAEYHLHKNIVTERILLCEQLITNLHTNLQTCLEAHTEVIGCIQDTRGRMLKYFLTKKKVNADTK